MSKLLPIRPLAMSNLVSTNMHTSRTNRVSGHHRSNAVRRLFSVLAISLSLAGLGLTGCSSTPQRATTNGKPGNNAPHEERNPSQHPEQFR